VSVQGVRDLLFSRSPDISRRVPITVYHDSIREFFATSIQVKSNGTLELRLARVSTPSPGPDQVLVRVEASPINPSNLGLLFGGADMTKAQATGTADEPVVIVKLPAANLRAEALSLDAIFAYGRQATGEKFLINPNLGLKG